MEPHNYLFMAIIELFVPIIGILTAPLIIWIVIKSKNAAKAEVQQTFRAIIESGQALTPEIIASLQEGAFTGRNQRDLRLGMLFIALGLGFGIFSLAVIHADNGKHLAVAATMLFIGLAYLGLWKYGQNKEPKAD